MNRRAEGFALMLAVFLIVTLSAVAAYLLTIQTGQTEAASQDEQSARAYLAARTGLDVAAYQILRGNAACAAVNQTLPLGQGLAGFSVTIQCTSSAEDEGERAGVTAFQLFRVTATGCNSGACPLASPGPTYVERQLTLTLAR
jgi:MSHA biogenesis protein MshP